MSAPPDLDPPGPSADALIRYRDQYELAIRDEDGRWDAAFGLWRGIGVGACLGILLVPLALVLDISSIDVLSVVSALSLAGGGYGALRTRLAWRGPGLTTSTENNEQRAALEEHRQRFAAIDMEVETLRRAGVEPREISQRAKQQADDAYSALRRRLERQSALLSPPVPLPPAPQSMTGSLPVTSPSADPAPITPARSSGGVTPRTDVLPIPEELIAAKRAGKLVPFIGAGLSLGLDVRGRFPNWAQLPGRMLDEIKAHRWDDADDRATLRGRFLIADPADPGREIARAKPLQDMLLELDTVKHKLGHDYANALSTIFLPHYAAPGESHRAVMSLQADFVLTTNYDQLLEAVEGPPLRQIYTWRQADRALAEVKRGRKVVFKVHGSAEDVDSVVLTASEYTRAHADGAYKTVVHHLLAAHTFLFIGYGMSDPSDLDIILRENASALKGGSLHFALLHRDQAGTVRRNELLRDYNIAVVPFADYAQLVPFLQALAAL